MPGWMAGCRATRAEHAGALPLVILKADDLEAAETAVKTAGGTCHAADLRFPGGRRFHFREPGGNELAVWSET
jgi:predicted enzyme related to lactoylglutathione lyase